MEGGSGEKWACKTMFQGSVYTRRFEVSGGSKIRFVCLGSRFSGAE
jgi:hypothetical protein